MKNICESIQEQMPEFMAGVLSDEQTTAIERHISKCANCSEYLQALQVDDKLFGDFAGSMASTVARLEKNVIETLEHGPADKMLLPISIWRTIMKSRIAKLAAAAVVIIVAALCIHQFGGTIPVTQAAFADVLEQVYKARTVTYKQTFYPGESREFTNQVMIIESGVMRSELPQGNIIIFDYNGGKNLHLMPQQKKAILTYRVGQPRRKGLFNYLDWVKTLHKKDGKLVGQEEIDGHIADVFLIQREFEKITVWVNPQTNLPVRVENISLPHPNKDIVMPKMFLSLGDFGGDASITRGIMIGSNSGIQEKMTIVMSDFQWDVDLDESLFDLEPPEGYSLEEKQFNVSDRGENWLIDALAFWTEMSEGLFPSAINDLCDPNLIRPMLIKKFDKDGDAKEEFEQACQMMNVVLQGLMFAQQCKVEGSWHYAGNGVKIGEANKPICWWKQKEKGGYRVIYGDLSVGDAEVEELPK